MVKIDYVKKVRDLVDEAHDYLSGGKPNRVVDSFFQARKFLDETSDLSTNTRNWERADDLLKTSVEEMGDLYRDLFKRDLSTEISKINKFKS